MKQTAETFEFDPGYQGRAENLAGIGAESRQEAVDLSAAIIAEPVEAQRGKLNQDLQTRQRRIITTLESLMALLNNAGEPTTQATTREGGDLVSKPEQFKKLDEALQQYMKEQKRILDQTASLAKSPSTTTTIVTSSSSRIC